MDLNSLAEFFDVSVWSLTEGFYAPEEFLTPFSLEESLLSSKGQLL